MMTEAAEHFTDKALDSIVEKWYDDWDESMGRVRNSCEK